MQQIVDLFRKAGVFYIATADGDKPRVRPFGFIMEFEGRLYFTTGNKKPVYAQLKKNPNTEITAMVSEGEWIRLEGRAVFDGNVSAKRRAFEIFPRFKDLYQAPENPDFEVFCLDSPSAVLCSMTEPPKKLL
ncbi:MAG: pyridoxamine 5'-phosphate oxidase family protein [Synergistaceae bacterium]|nr:pyridoxamine 5'-phosphate oxidase family protein [Synergistaceae bacterium]